MNKVSFIRLTVILLLPLLFSLHFGVRLNSNGSFTVTQTFIAEASIQDTFEPQVSGDDGQVTFQNGFYPPTDCDSAITNSTVITIDKTRQPASTTRTVSNGFFRWDTSSIPNNAVVSAATFRIHPTGHSNFDSRNLEGEWYSPSNWPIDCTDWVASVGNTAFSVSIDTITDSTYNNLALTTPTNVSLTTYTALRIGISGGDPPSSSFNQVTGIKSQDNGSNLPQLQVTYTYSLGTPNPSSVSPSLVDNLGSWNLTVTGSNFDDIDTNASANAQLALTRSGQASIDCTSESITSSGTSLSASCSFSAVATGFWNIVVTNSDSSTGSLGSAVEVTNQPQGSTQDLGAWNFTGALYTSQFTTVNESPSGLVHQVIGFPISTNQLVDDQFLSEDTLNGGLERNTGERWGGMPGSTTLAVESFKSYDSSLATFTTDTTDANDSGANDVTLLPSTVEVGDRSLVGMTYPGRILTFNIGDVPAGADWTCKWVYHDGTTFQDLPGDVIDDTDCLTVEGTNTIQFTLPSDIVDTAVDGVTSYWIGMEILTVTTSVTVLGTQIWWETGLWYSVAESLEANGGSQSLTYYLSGPTMGCCQQLFPGDTGITTGDAVELEPATDATIDILAYIDTSAQTNKLIVSKDTFLRIRSGSDFSGANGGYVSYDINGGAVVQSVTQVASGLQRITFSTVGGTCTLTVENVGSTSGACPSIGDNATDWSWGTNDSVLFFDYIDLEVPSGTEVLRYQLQGQPTLTIEDTASSGSPDDGTMSFPEPPTAGLVGTVGPFRGVVQDQPSIQDNPLPIIPDTQYFGEETGTNLPGQSFFTELITTNSGTASRLDSTLVQLLWIGVGVGIVLVVGGIVTRKTQNAVWGGLGMLVAFLPVALLEDGVLPFWMFFGLLSATALTAALRGYITRPSG